MNALDNPTFFSEGDLKILVSFASNPLLSELAAKPNVGGW
jgi:hypothetical protein